ncbi:VOC family protein [Stackebrandtia albiflava]|uniref:VOC family protein n=1 Tax=Stackebrandtia albiflava TaxID=406432 RepID=UPI001B875032|nr:VOC family protein [Stackebrandtia albiflava]
MRPGRPRTVGPHGNRLPGIPTERDPNGVVPERWRRSDRWGVVWDTDDVPTLTRFYSALRGRRIWKMDEEGSASDSGEGVAYLGVRFNPDYVHPEWPAPSGAQQMMPHLDFQVTDLAAETARTVSSGAEPCEHRPQDDVRVLRDPVGHPFCLYT